MTHAVAAQGGASFLVQGRKGGLAGLEGDWGCGGCVAPPIDTGQRPQQVCDRCNAADLTHIRRLIARAIPRRLRSNMDCWYLGHVKG